MSNLSNWSVPKFDPATSPEETEAFFAQARKASDLLKAMSHETRLVILCLLSEGERSVGDIEAILSMPQAAVSQQLARLRLDRLVKTRRNGRTVYYRLASEEVTSLIGTLYELFCAPVRTTRSGD
ncbi:ArsR/SmtB family transcription factor [Aurantimonas endophytica]|uniref:DNA-binding transcriptional ArsR family regulator n=1 Tax=Aurantimonas endophytica TaxID=1522175 RepID=A0A7W6MQK4_9HYPH|nr:metalloregulator ArsR/SmtB family transcription factor [Aurantimonas endophytica]MBB4004068.1 DNA-binding transcriptional ArsR family regulator [Aurantimonas endophytica]